MRTFRYSREHPEGKIFDTEPHRDDPYPPPTPAQGWYDNPGVPEMRMTTDQVIEAVVKAELAKQDSNRLGLEREVLKKTGYRARTTAPDKKLTDLLDDK